MTDPVKDGGPAFPRTGEGFGNPRYDAPGMSLRDWFAGQAVAGLTASSEAFDSSGVAYHAYTIADALLLARQEKPNG